AAVGAMAAMFDTTVQVSVGLVSGEAVPPFSKGASGFSVGISGMDSIIENPYLTGSTGLNGFLFSLFPDEREK
ncbi:MAG: hypothetical protein P8Y38_04185, partial [Deltaproteobacteria bacterium]